MAFYDLDQNMDLIEEFVRFVVSETYRNCRPELEVLERDLTLFENIAQPFPRITYDEAVQIIKGEKEVNGKNAITAFRQDLEQTHEKLKQAVEQLNNYETQAAQPNLKKGEVNYFKNKIDTLKNEARKLEDDTRNIAQWIKLAQNFQHGNDFGSPDERAITRLYNVPVMVYRMARRHQSLLHETLR